MNIVNELSDDLEDDSVWIKLNGSLHSLLGYSIESVLEKDSATLLEGISH